MRNCLKLWLISIVFVFAFTGCGTKIQLPDNPIVFERGETEDYAYIIWDEKTYVPFCASELALVGDCLGYYEEDGDKTYVCELDGQSSDEWIVDTLDLNCNEGMIYKEEDVTEIPEGLSSDYAWNTIEVVDETAYYQLIKMGYMYYCKFYDENHQIVKTEGSLNRQPHLSLTDDHTVMFTLQTGTGLSTQWGYFYDAKMNLFSQTYNSIYDVYNKNVVYRDKNRLIVRGIFDYSSYYEEIASFQYPLSNAAEPFEEVKFTDDGTALEVTYLTGDDFEHVTETFELNLAVLDSEYVEVEKNT